MPSFVLFDNLIDSLPTVLEVTQYLMMILGAISIGIGVKTAMDASKPGGHATAGAVISEIAVGAILMASGTWLPMIIQTISGGNYSTPLSYLPSAKAENDPFSKMMKTLLSVVQYMGIVAIFRGLWVFRKLSRGNGDGESAVWVGAMHIFFGALAANIKVTLSALAGFIGMSVPSFVQ